MAIETLRFDAEVSPTSVGMRPDRVKEIVRVFDEQIARGLHFGAQLVVARHGEVVVDRVGGQARRNRKVDVDTMFHCFSITKPFTAVCIHRLVQEGRVELDEPIATYWPEFGCKGKERATIRHALLHQAGIPSRGIYLQVPLWPDWRRVTKNVAGLTAEYVPGTITSYHFVNFGFILGEVVKRVSGMSIKDYMQGVILGPLALSHTYLGLPTSKLRDASHIYCGDLAQAALVFAFNQQAIRSATMPAATLNSTARDLAVFFQTLLNGGRTLEYEMLTPDSVFQATMLRYHGRDKNVGADMNWAMGFHLGGIRRPTDPPGAGMGYGSSLNTFGHYGQNCCMAWADRERELVVCFLTNRLLSGEASTRRFQEISDSVWQALD